MIFRKATRDDVAVIVKLLVSDDLGKRRENAAEPLPESYYKAFERIRSDDNQELIVLDDEREGIVGTFQISFIPYLTYQGGIRAQIEAVRIREDQRSKGLGEKLLKWAIARAKERRAHVLQLTTDKLRPGAIQFYERMGFIASHEGMKLHFSPEK